MHRPFTPHLRAVVAALLFGLSAAAQQPAGPDKNVLASTTDVDHASNPGVASDTPSPSDKPSGSKEGLQRWLEFNNLSLSLRWRSELSLAGFHYFDNGQQRSVADGHFNFAVTVSIRSTFIYPPDERSIGPTRT